MFKDNSDGQVVVNTGILSVSGMFRGAWAGGLSWGAPERVRDSFFKNDSMRPTFNHIPAH